MAAVSPWPSLCAKLAGVNRSHRLANFTSQLGVLLVGAGIIRVLFENPDGVFDLRILIVLFTGVLCALIGMEWGK